MVAGMVSGKVKLTNAVVAAQAIPPAVNGKASVVTVWDATLPGFCVRVHSGGSRTFGAKCRVRGEQRWITIGRFGSITADAARREAKAILGEAAAGRDPAPRAPRQKAAAEPEPEDPAAAALTLDKLYALWRSEYGERCLSSCATDDKVHRRVKPKLGSKLIVEITRADVRELHQELAGVPAMANKVVRRLHVWFAWATDEEHLPEAHTNPAVFSMKPKRRAIRLYPERSRDVALSPAQLALLGAGLEREAKGSCRRYIDGAWRCMPTTRDRLCFALRLLAVTGMRRGEVEALRRDTVDTTRGAITLQEHKTEAHHGAKRIALGEAAKAILAEALERWSDPVYVFPGLHRGTPIGGLAKFWRVLRGELEASYAAETGRAERITIHDLRHTFMTLGIDAGGDMRSLGKNLGHTQIGTMARYNNQRDERVRAEADRAGTLISDAIGGNVIPLKPQDKAA